MVFESFLKQLKIDVGSMGWSRRLLFVLKLAVCLGVIGFYFFLAKITSSGSNWIVADFLEMLKIFGVDDAYRFYSIKEAWLRPELFSWSYILPVQLVIDGLASSWLDHDLFYMRCFHILPLLGSLFFIYRSGRLLSINKEVMFLSTLIVACMPLYVFVFLSFYGEAWLTLFSSAAMYAFLSGRLNVSALLLGLMPLIRPEGIFFVLFPGLYALLKRNIILLGALLLPGFSYLIWLLFSLESFSDFYAWRDVFKALMASMGDVQGYYRNNLLSTFNLAWSLPAVVALMMPGMRRLWPLSLSVATVCLFYASIVMTRQGFYEARYFLSVVPLLAIAWAYFFQKVFFGEFMRLSITGASFLFGFLSLLIGMEHLLQSDPLKASYGFNRRWPLQGPTPVVSSFIRYDDEQMRAPSEVADAIYTELKKNPKVDSVLIYDAPVFYYLDPQKIPDHVSVSIAPFVPGLLGNNLVGLHPEGRQHGIYGIHSFKPSSTRALLYVGRLNCPLCVPVFSSNVYNVYLWGYEQKDFHEVKGLLERSAQMK